MRRLRLTLSRDDRLKPYRPNKKAIGKLLIFMQGILNVPDEKLANLFESSQWCLRCTQTGRGDGYATVSIYFADLICPTGLMALKREAPDQYRKTPFVEPVRPSQATLDHVCKVRRLRQPPLPTPIPIREFLESVQVK
ncbi:hypothetical protein [Thiomicrospira sp. ALE5]|uniref:hypothetical protein n=1 Tax=Thiomicrospira sp. ALE5 TaxID=748650 RepID=UPI0008EAD972|nr:hypothetical protein [Thiomicrospira sp. ALE5]SFR52636.1 hypothetical protein SAMN03092900_0721 [Thiomicrospira sp. ALE5]